MIFWMNLSKNKLYKFLTDLDKKLHKIFRSITCSVSFRPLPASVINTLQANFDIWDNKEIKFKEFQSSLTKSPKLWAKKRSSIFQKGILTMGRVLAKEETPYCHNLQLIKTLKHLKSVINCNCGIKSAWTSSIRKN